MGYRTIAVHGDSGRAAAARYALAACERGADALPLLRPAGRVTSLTLDDGRAPAPPDGADMAPYLSRHGVRADIACGQTGADAGLAPPRAAAICR